MNPPAPSTPPVQTSARIRPARPADAPILAKLWREMWDFHAQVDPRFEAGPAANRAMAEWLGGHADNPDACLLVGEDEGRPVGYALALILENPPVVTLRRYGFISELTVTADARRRGVGTLLLDGVHRWLRGKGVTEVEVNVAARNPVSRSFWKKNGYAEYVERYRKSI